MISDAFLPSPSEFLNELTADTEVIGRVDGFSDSGVTPEAFAVVALTLGHSVVVPIDRLRVVLRDTLSPS